MKRDDAMPPRRGHGPPSPAQKLRRGRRRLLGEWRGIEPEEDTSANVKSIASVVQSVLKKVNAVDRMSHEDIAAQWPAAVGDFLAKHSRPVSLRRGILHIAVVQPAIRYDMERRLKKEILTKLQQHFGETIRGLKFENG